MQIEAMRLFLVSLGFVLLGLAGFLTVAAQECSRIHLTAKTRPNARRSISAGNAKATIIVTLRSRDSVDVFDFKLSSPSGLSMVRTAIRPA